MNLLCLLVFILGVSASYSLSIDITSIKMDTDLYRLCWKRLDNKTMDSVRCRPSESGDFKVCPVNVIISNGVKLFCLQNSDISSIFEIEFNLEDPKKEKLLMKVKFSLPLGPPLPVIRKKIGSTYVLFQLNTEFAGYRTTNDSNTDCQLFIEYESNNETKIEKQLFNSQNSTQGRLDLEPGTSFTSFYSCNLTHWQTSTSFIKGSGFIYPKEQNADQELVIKYPFRRFIFAQWKIPINIPKCYFITIYKLESKKNLICVKTFRAYSVSENPRKVTAVPNLNSKCKEKQIEDLGFYNVEGKGNIYAMLDMNTALERNTVYKFSIEFISPINTTKKRFIYFEPFKNEWAGIINKKMENYNATSNVDWKMIYPDFLQNVVSNFPTNPVNTGMRFNLTKALIIPTISGAPPVPTQGKSFQELRETCENITNCGKDLYPFFYAIFRKEIDGNSFSVDIAQVYKKGNLIQLSEISLEPNNDDLTFNVSWNVINTNFIFAPSIYIIRMKLDQNDTCVAQYILECRTCNTMDKELSLKKLKNEFSKSKCDTEKSYLNYFEAWTMYINFKTEKMKPGLNYTAGLYFYNSDFNKVNVQSEARLIQVAGFSPKKLFDHYIPISIICSVIGLIVFIVIIKYSLMARNQEKLSEKEDSNKYYCEDDF